MYGKGKFTVVNDNDFEVVDLFKWTVDINGYARSSVDIEGKRYDLWIHRLVNNTPEGLQTDHINRIPLDNRKANLRSCTIAQNQHNREDSHGISKYKGVAWHKRDKQWQASLEINDRCKFLGYHKTQEEAAVAYNLGAIKYFGEFACLNQIKEGEYEHI